jgi:hypothetical protein
MSPVLQHFCIFIRSLPDGCVSPSKYGTIGCIPEPVNRVEGSFSGTKLADGISYAPLFIINSEYEVLI